MPFAAELVATVQQIQNRKTEGYMRDNVSSMAVKREMQAQLMRLDLLENVFRSRPASLAQERRRRPAAARAA